MGIAEAQRFADVMRAEMRRHDLQDSEDGSGIDVLAERADGTLYRIGWVNQALVFQDPECALMAIERIKFGGTARRKG